ncbi:MAG TPA: DUF1684 domain-containing protein [Polyangia bacterium]
MNNPTGIDEAAHHAEVEAWRAQRAKNLRSDEGWLVVAGLFFLDEGENRFGSAPDNPIELPSHSAPAHAGHFLLEGDRVTVVPAPETKMLLAGQPIGRYVLAADEPGPADVLALGDLRLFVVLRDGQRAIRLRDLQSPLRTQFRGVPHFPVRAEYRVRAAFVPHADSATRIAVTNQVGKVTDTLSPGKVVFELAGKRLSLDALLDDATSKRLTILFRDGTSGRETYGAGRFLYSEGLPNAGEVVLDFNKAYNPPCAFNPLVVCPLPPPQNRLDVRVEAGEMLPHEAH